MFKNGAHKKLGASNSVTTQFRWKAPGRPVSEKKAQLLTSYHCTRASALELLGLDATKCNNSQPRILGMFLSGESRIKKVNLDRVKMLFKKKSGKPIQKQTNTQKVTKRKSVLGPKVSEQWSFFLSAFKKSYPTYQEQKRAILSCKLTEDELSLLESQLPPPNNPAKVSEWNTAVARVNVFMATNTNITLLEDERMVYLLSTIPMLNERLACMKSIIKLGSTLETIKKECHDLLQGILFLLNSDGLKLVVKGLLDAGNHLNEGTVYGQKEWFNVTSLHAALDVFSQHEEFGKRCGQRRHLVSVVAAELKSVISNEDLVMLQKCSCIGLRPLVQLHEVQKSIDSIRKFTSNSEEPLFNQRRRCSITFGDSGDSPRQLENIDLSGFDTDDVFLDVVGSFESSISEPLEDAKNVAGKLVNDYIELVYFIGSPEEYMPLNPSDTRPNAINSLVSFLTKYESEVLQEEKFEQKAVEAIRLKEKHQKILEKRRQNAVGGQAVTPATPVTLPQLHYSSELNHCSVVEEKSKASQNGSRKVKSENVGFIGDRLKESQSCELAPNLRLERLSTDETVGAAANIIRCNGGIGENSYLHIDVISDTPLLSDMKVSQERVNIQKPRDENMTQGNRPSKTGFRRLSETGLNIRSNCDDMVPRPVTSENGSKERLRDMITQADTKIFNHTKISNQHSSSSQNTGYSLNGPSHIESSSSENKILEVPHIIRPPWASPRNTVAKILSPTSDGNNNISEPNKIVSPEKNCKSGHFINNQSLISPKKNIEEIHRSSYLTPAFNKGIFSTSTDVEDGIRMNGKDNQSNHVYTTPSIASPSRKCSMSAPVDGLSISSISSLQGGDVRSELTKPTPSNETRTRPITSGHHNRSSKKSSIEALIERYKNGVTKTTSMMTDILDNTKVEQSTTTPTTDDGNTRTGTVIPRRSPLPKSSGPYSNEMIGLTQKPIGRRSPISGFGRNSSGIKSQQRSEDGKIRDTNRKELVFEGVSQTRSKLLLE